MVPMSRMNDGSLVRAFRAGEAGAFEHIVRRHYAGLLRVAEQRCGTGALAEDAVQAGLVRAHRYLRGPGAIENLGAWLRRVVYNCATDLLKRERREAGLELATDVAAPGEDRLERQELRGIVADAIGRLPAIYGAPLTMHYLHGLDAREIAAQLDDNLNSVKSRIARGRRELRRRLEHVLEKAGYL
jgi:RNA polymerase sigma-70 factor (ECF subfamily)